MQRPRIDISPDLDGDAVVHACFDLSEPEVSASAHAMRAMAAERFRTSEMSADDVLELREFTALADELGEIPAGARTMVMRPSRLSVYRQSVAGFVESRYESEWIRDDDREPLALLSELLQPLEQLCAEAMRAALSPSQRAY